MKMKKAFAVLLALVMALSLLPAAALATGNTVTVTSETTEWTDGNTYVVDSDVTISSRIVVIGSVTLQLNAGCTLTAQQGITLHEGNTLTINGSGTLNATGNTNSGYTSDGNAGIGSERQGSAGTLIVNGGTINATGGKYAAGIGGGTYGRGCTVIINGGTVNASGTNTGAGIGGGGNRYWGGSYGHSGTVTINGGVVNAHGAGYGAGIGGGGSASTACEAGVFDRNVVINGGQVTATSDSGYGIGPGSRSDGLTAGSNATITLGWTNASDFINVKSYRGALTFANSFLLDGTQTAATAENAGGNKLVPDGLCTVTFDSNDGGAVTTQSVEQGASVTRPENPVREGYSFRGWFVDGAATAWNFSSPVTANMTLRAQWAWNNGAQGAILNLAGNDGDSGDHGPARLLDGNLDSKWCLPISDPVAVSFRTASPVVPTGYLLSTANNANTYPARNPDDWTLEGKLYESDEWTVLASVTDDAVLPGTAFTQCRFPLNNAVGNASQTAMRRCSWESCGC